MNFSRTFTYAKTFVGRPESRKLKRYKPIVEEINFLEEEIELLMMI